MFTTGHLTTLFSFLQLAYEQTYGNEPIWVKYRRNFKGAWAPKTRKMCIVRNTLSS